MTAIFLNTCDKNQDVCKYFLIAFEKYWSNNSLTKFAGVNYHDNDVKQYGFVPVKSSQSNWKEETLFQLKQIKIIAPEITNLIVFLDDFILSTAVDNQKILELVNNIKNEDIKYIRLKCVEEGFFYKILNYLTKKIKWGCTKGIRIRNNHPYYSSLQVAIWDIDYLIMCVQECSSIWDFETSKPYHLPHYSVYNNLLNYRHIVEKGQWEIDANSYCKNYLGFFVQGKRPIRNLSFIEQLRFHTRKPVFFIFGYLIVKLKLFYKK